MLKDIKRVDFAEGPNLPAPSLHDLMVSAGWPSDQPLPEWVRREVNDGDTIKFETIGSATRWFINGVEVTP